MKTTHPHTLLEAANLVPISGKTALSKEPIERDVELLLTTFASQSSHNFNDFSTCWNELGFVHVHFACLEKDSREAFMQAFYNAILHNFANNLPNIRAGVVFALYFMYFSQPAIWDRAQIRVTRDLWIQLFDYYLQCAQQKRDQVVLVFKQLKDDDAFMFTCELHLQTPNVFEQQEMAEPNAFLEKLLQMKRRRLENDATSSCIPPKFEAMAKKYQQCKQLACASSHATLATKKWIQGKTKVKESNRRILQEVILKSTLAIDESKFLEELRHASENMWAARKNRLCDYDTQDS